MNDTSTNPAEGSSEPTVNDLFVQLSEAESTIQDDGNTLLYSEGWKNLLKLAGTDDNKKAKGFVNELMNAGYKPMFYITREEYDRMKNTGIVNQNLSKKKITIGRPPLTPKNEDYVLVMVNDIDVDQITPNTRTGKEEIFQGVIGITTAGFNANQLSFVDPKAVDINEEEGISYFNPAIEKRTQETREEVREEVHQTMGPKELVDQLKEAEEVINSQDGEILYSKYMDNVYKAEEINETEDAEDMVADLLSRGYRPMIAVPKSMANQINEEGFSQMDFSKYTITIGRTPSTPKDTEFVLVKINNIEAQNIIPQTKSGKEKIFRGRVDLIGSGFGPEDLSIIDPTDKSVDELDGVNYVE